MYLGTRLAGTKLTLSPRSGTASRTLNSQYLFWVEFFFHGRKIMTHSPCAKMVNFEQLLKMDTCP